MSYEEFEALYKPIKQIKGRKKGPVNYLIANTKQELAKVSLIYEMYCWSYFKEEDKIINGRTQYCDAFLITSEPHYVDEKIVIELKNKKQ